MSIDLVTEILAAHADQLNKGEEIEEEALLATFPNESEELAPLLDLAARVKNALRPVSPAPEFRARLRDGLIMAARHKQSQRILVERKGEGQWSWLIGAAAITSAAGLIAVVWRSRAQAQRAALAVAPAELERGLERR